MYSSERHFQREGLASLVPLSHTLKKKGGRCDKNALYSKQFLELPYQTNPLSFCQTNSGERAGDKEMKGGKEDTEVNNRGSTEGRRSDESCLDCVATFMNAATVHGTVTDAGLRGIVGYMGTRTFVVPSIETYLFSKHTL